MSSRNEHFRNAARGPLKYGAPGPARRILKMFISKKLKRAAPPGLHRGRIGLVRPSVATSEIIIFKMRRAGPGPGPSAPHFENDDFEKN